MIPTQSYAAQHAGAPLRPWRFQRRAPGPRDVHIAIRYCGLCHSDVHQVRDEWGGAHFPMVPGHEIVGEVVAVGREVTRFRPGDRAAVGCLVDSCRTCPSCEAGLENYCENGFSATYNSFERDGVTATQGGYSDGIVVDEAFVLRLDPHVDLAATAPLLCAGITTWSPLRHWRVGPGQRVGVVGLGGLGHMAVKLAKALGAHVTVLTTSPAKRQDALRLGADEAVIWTEPGALPPRGLDLILDTVAAVHDLAPLLQALRREGTLVLVGAPERPLALEPFDLIGQRRAIAGSLIGGIAQTQEMLDFCAQHGIVSDVEVVAARDLDAAFERMVRGDVRYRFVLDAATLRE